MGRSAQVGRKLSHEQNRLMRTKVRPAPGKPTLIGKYSISPPPMVRLDRRLNSPGADCRAHAAKAIFPKIYLLISQGGKAAACLCAAVFASLRAV